MTQTKQEDKKEKLYPRKLVPPPDVLRKMIQKERDKKPKNKILRFFHTFFGEGF